MVDFKKLAQEMYERATPEERARINAYNQTEAHYNQSRRGITAEFTRYCSKQVKDDRGRTRYETYPVREWTGQIEMRIEDRTGHNGREYEILRFIGGPTGHEAYEISDDFIRILREDMPEGCADRLTICGGSANYDRCWVSCDEVLRYLSEFRPTFFPEITPIPAEKPIPAFLRR
jgi:hypothetical protein|nr:hypothetical protein [Neorhizobium tomejilense]